MLARPIAEARSSPTMSLSSLGPRREVEEASDGRVPPVSDRLRRESARAAPEWAERDRPACGPSSWAARSIMLFPFFLLCKICFMFDFV